MKRRNGSGRFNPESFEGEDINPMDGVANLSDVMLIFACGLMLALITYWNVDVTGLKGSVDVSQGKEITQDVDGFSSENEENASDVQYEEYGVVYRDPNTGQLYLVTEGE